MYVLYIKRTKTIYLTDHLSEKSFIKSIALIYTVLNFIFELVLHSIQAPKNYLQISYQITITSLDDPFLVTTLYLDPKIWRVKSFPSRVVRK